MSLAVQAEHKIRLVRLCAMAGREVVRDEPRMHADRLSCPRNRLILDHLQMVVVGADLLEQMAGLLHFTVVCCIRERGLCMLNTASVIDRVAATICVEARSGRGR